MNKINFFFEGVEHFMSNKSSIIKYINALIEKEIYKTGEISVVFCSDNYLLQINNQYLNHNYYTDIITFNYVVDKIVSGDLFISIDRIKENAIKFNSEIEKELIRVIFHGILHLIGYNDKTEEEQKIMRERENYYLNNVDFREIIL